MEIAQDRIPSSESSHLKFIEGLEHEYRSLCRKEHQIVRLQERLILEETELERAMEMAKDVPTTAKKPRSRKDQEREALKWLEAALMEESSGDDGDSSTKEFREPHT